MTPIHKPHRSLLTLGLVAGGVIVGYLAGLISSPALSVRAEVTETPRREAFKAAGAADEPILKEISATLKRIESRVERIERNTAAKK